MFSCKNLIVIVVAMYLVLYVLKDDTSKMVVGGATLFFLYNNGLSLREGLEGDTSDDSLGFQAELIDNTSSVVGNNTVSAGGARPGNLVKASTVNTGPYDGLCLKTGNQEYWMKSPDETSLVPNDTLYTYLSSQGPIKMKLSDQAALRGPPVDGVKGSFEKMFMWANNTTSPLCCPSTFSTSTGCVCSTKNQRDFIAGRGDILNGSKDEVEV
tara:strand:+ start:7467 stop:8102 length:636 start_codon:yes stop_codon:yes gene_type:complete